VVSILVSKQAGRYRIQGDSYASLYLIVEELEHRLNMKLMNNDINSHRYITSSSTTTSTSAAANSSNNNSIVKCTDALPLDHYFSIITAHFNTRLQLNQLMSRLNDLAHQYRMLEKRLLVRYKDRNPTALNGLDILIRETYSKIIRLSETIAKLIIIAIIPSINHFHPRHHLYRRSTYCSHPYHISYHHHRS
jgi:Bardet-Biedl syndrome 9 protein